MYWCVIFPPYLMCITAQSPKNPPSRWSLMILAVPLCTADKISMPAPILLKTEMVEMLDFRRDDSGE